MVSREDSFFDTGIANRQEFPFPPYPNSLCFANTHTGKLWTPGIFCICILRFCAYYKDTGVTSHDLNFSQYTRKQNILLEGNGPVFFSTPQGRKTITSEKLIWSSKRSWFRRRSRRPLFRCGCGPWSLFFVV